MKVAFFNNNINHHQVWVSDEFYNRLNDDFKYVVTSKKTNQDLKGGINYNSRPYCIIAHSSPDNLRKSYELAINADVCIFGAESLEYAVYRAKNTKKLSFEVSERWLKRGLINILSPRLIKWFISYNLYFRNKPFYKLCSSAFAANDHKKLYTYINKCYKWGYFPKDLITNMCINNVPPQEGRKIKIMWCARFITVKHAELVIKAAAKLKKQNYNYYIDMFGSGVLENKMKQLSKSLNVDDIINFKGAKPNDIILEEMRNHHIFLFTSDQKEGWGAVVNEAMSNGCVVIGGNKIGSIPYLIKDGINGLIFKDQSSESLAEKIELLLENPSLLPSMSREARRTIEQIWSASKAVTNFLQLVYDIQNKIPCSVKEGPGSKA